MPFEGIAKTNTTNTAWHIPCPIGCLRVLLKQIQQTLLLRLTSKLWRLRVLLKQIQQTQL